MSSMSTKLARNKEGIAAYIVFAIVLILFAVNQNDFASRYGVQSLFNQVITLVTVSLAQTLVILTGGIDLSIGAIVGLSNAVMATLFLPVTNVFGGNVLLGSIAVAIISIIAGAIAGALNGFFVVHMRLQPIIVTLATSSVFLGIGMYIRPTPGGDVSMDFAKFLTGRVFVYLPVSAIVIAILLLLWILIRRSKLGQCIYAVGGNEYSAFLSGVNVDRTKLIVYMLSGVFAAVAGVLLTAQTASGDPLGTSTFTINSISATIMGGVALSGGKGSYIGTIAGSFILSLVLGLLIFWSIPSFYQNAVQGGILLLVLVSLGISKLKIRR